MKTLSCEKRRFIIVACSCKEQAVKDFVAEHGKSCVDSDYLIFYPTDVAKVVSKEVFEKLYGGKDNG